MSYEYTQRLATLRGYSWAGPLDVTVRIVGETPKRYRITPKGAEPVRLSGRTRWLQPFETTLVPKGAIVL